MWPANASLAVVANYPFVNAPSDETPTDYAVRAYLEALWMPEVCVKFIEAWVTFAV